MACRIKNTGTHVFCLDLRGGEALYLQPGEVSRPLREELLYGNPYLAGWLRQGLAQRLDVSFREVLAWEVGRSPEELRKELRSVKGIGAKAAARLVDEGVLGLEPLARYEVDHLAALLGWKEPKAQQVLASAREILAGAPGEGLKKKAQQSINED